MTVSGTDGTDTGTDSVDNGTDGTGTGTKGAETGTKMSKGVVFGVAIILAVVAVAALVAVLVSGKKEDEVTIQNTTVATSIVAGADNFNYTQTPELEAQEVFMQTNNSCKCLRTFQYNCLMMMFCFQFHFLLTFVLFSPWRGSDQG